MNNINVATTNFDFTSASLIIFILMFFYPVRWRFKLLMSILFVAMASVSQMFLVMLIAYLTKSDILGTKYLVITMSLAAVAFFLLCEIIAKIKSKYQDDTEIPMSIFFAMIPVTSIVLILLIFTEFINKNGATNICNLIILLGIIYINLMMFYLFGKMSDLFWERREKKLLQRQIVLQAKHYEQLEVYQSEIRSIRHDMKKHLLTLHQLIDGNNKVDTDSYLSSLLEGLNHQ